MFWVLTTPLVFQLTYASMDQSRVLGSTVAVWAAYLAAESGYALVLVGLVRLRRGYWNWVARI